MSVLLAIAELDGGQCGAFIPKDDRLVALEVEQSDVGESSFLNMDEAIEWLRSWGIAIGVSLSQRIVSRGKLQFFAGSQWDGLPNELAQEGAAVGKTVFPIRFMDSQDDTISLFRALRAQPPERLPS
jgi:hypothetical protein